MSRLTAVIALAMAAGVALADEQRIGEHGFTLPDGFSIEKVAGPPLVDRPIACALDEQGRLYVTDSSGSNEPVREQLAKKPHRVVRLVDADGDGVYDSSTVFADHMMFPEGILWHAGSVWVGAPPSIWKLTDTDDDGVADVREEWFNGKTLTGCANDLHGPYAGIDGTIYWCKGAFARQIYERDGREPFVTRAAHVFRRRSDGGDIEAVMTGGMDNPVDVDFSPEGERFITTTFFQHPGGGRRDGLIHILYGGVYGKRHDVLDGHPRTGELLPPLTHMGAAAPCGLTRYRSTSFGASYRDNLFATLFNMHKVTRHELTPEGATYRSRDSDFVVSDNRDFHPTDVVEDADGSLLVVDTGGWYKLCCPTSQLVKPDVLGAIYRVRRDDAPPVGDPRGLELDWSLASAELVARLDDARPAVRERARATLAKHGEAALESLGTVLGESPSVAARRNAVWTLARVRGPAARAVARTALRDSSASVRHAACHATGLHRDGEALDALLGIVATDSPGVRRAAAEALGRIGDATAAAKLLAAAARAPDRALEHSLLYACIEIGDTTAPRAALASKSARLRRAALVVLAEMPGSRVEPERVASFLDADERELRETARWIVSRRPGWGAALLEHLRGALASAGDDAPAMALLADFARGDDAVRALLAETVEGEDARIASRLAALRAMREAGVEKPPASWTRALTRAAAHAELFDSVLETSARLNLAGDLGTLDERFAAVAVDPARPPLVRLTAVAASHRDAIELSSELFTLAIERLSAATSPPERNAAVRAITRAKLSPAQLRGLVRAVGWMGPFVINDVFPTFDPLDEELAIELLERLAEAPALGALRGDVLSRWLERRGGALRERGRKLLAELDGDPEERRARLEALLGEIERLDGDVRRGQLVFNSEKAACRTCHEIGYLGGDVGPDLTNIGKTRSARDLLEAIVFPSASFVRSYEPTLVVTKRGEAWTGIVRASSPEEIVLVAAPDRTHRVRRTDIREHRPARSSVMPSGLDAQLSARELADLIAFLRASGR